MRPLLRPLVLCLALASIADAAIVGTGDSIAIAGGNGVDLLVWRDASTGRIKAMRIGASGAPLDAVPFDLPLPPGRDPEVTWDGSGFLVTVSGSNTLLVRLPITGGAAFTLSFASSPPAQWSTVASKKDGSSLLVWSTGSRTYASVISADGDTSMPQTLDWGATESRLVRDGLSYQLVWLYECFFPVCPSSIPAYFLRLDDAGNPGARASLETGIENLSLSTWSIAEGVRTLLSASADGSPAATHLFSLEPGMLRAARSTIRFPEPLVAVETASGQALLALGARIDVSDTGAPRTVNWAPVPEGRRLAGVLPSSGRRVIADADGAGSISVESAVALTSEVGLAPVFVSPTQIWLKIDNRGPEAPKLIDLWVTGRVRNFNSARLGTITRFGEMTRMRFDTTLHKGAGYEVAMFFEEPVDTTAFEAWVLPLGTDRDATNNYVSTRATPEPEPPPGRRRVVSR